MMCSRDYISPLVLIHILKGCKPPDGMCSRDYISPLVFIQFRKRCTPLALIRSRDYISVLLFILPGCMLLAVTCSSDSISQMILIPLLQR